MKGGGNKCLREDLSRESDGMNDGLKGSSPVCLHNLQPSYLCLVKEKVENYST